MPPRPIPKKHLIEVVHGDCRQVIPKVADRERFRLIFADPPFNIGQEYAGYTDRMSEQQYAEFSIQWISACCKALLPGGVLCLHGPDSLVDIYIVAMSAARLLKRWSWVNWHYRFGQCGRTNWIDARCHCLIYVWGDKPEVWNPEAVLVESDRATVYADKRVHETENGGKRLPGTVWGVPSDGPYWGRVQGNNEERREGHPNQLPEVYLERLVRAYTNPGDRVLDPFGGSGTTAVVCQELRRRCVTCDISGENVASIQQRLVKGAVRVKER